MDAAEPKSQNPDQALWRDIHLQRYDDPRTAGAFVKPRDGFDWKRRVQDREFVGRVFREWTEERYDELVSAKVLISTARHGISEIRTDRAVGTLRPHLLDIDGHVPRSPADGIADTSPYRPHRPN
jgi:hypothetical protein